MQSAASSRSFGLLLASLFFLLAVLSYWGRGHLYPYWGTAGVVFLVISFLMPRVLAPLKRMWLKLGNVLHRVVGPAVLGLSYVIAIVPVGLLTRMFGKDLLAQRWDGSAQSYWRKRSTGGPAGESLRDQF